ncbi:MAG: ABC transporter permease [Pseudomonadota bacterium]
MTGLATVFRREFAGYFSSPIALVFIFIFLVLAGVFTFFIGGFYARGQADLVSFFSFHPWLYLFLVPALTMRLWAEERKTGTIEVLLTLPVSLAAAVTAKFLAAWIFTALALALTSPIWISVNYLGDPDNGVIVAGYLGSWLMAGAFIAIGSFLSALTDNQIIAFILTAVCCFILVAAGFPLVLDAFQSWAPSVLLDAIASMSVLTHFEAIGRGVLDLRDLGYFLVVIVCFLLATSLVVTSLHAD